MQVNRHQTDDQLELYVLGRLNGSELAELEEHLIVCQVCRDRLDNLEHFSVGMKEALLSSWNREAAPAPGRWGWFEWLRQPAAPIAVAVVALAAILSIMSSVGAKIEPVSFLTLTATRGETPSAAPARELDLTLADSPTNGAIYRVEVLNAAGQTVWSGPAQSTSSGVQVKTQRQLPPGDYFVRLQSDSGQVLREYGFRIRQ